MLKTLIKSSCWSRDGVNEAPASSFNLQLSKVEQHYVPKQVKMQIWSPHIMTVSLQAGIRGFQLSASSNHVLGRFN